MTRITADWLTSDASQTVCRVLADAGYEAWFVGGCVRNALIGAPVADLDLSTNAHPQTVMDLAKSAGLRVIPTGFDHGTVTVVVDGAAFEITTFRKDVATDGRRAVVAFAQSMEDDARRRDFTMNALYCGADGVVVDPLGGLPDLHARKVRFIDDAGQRIREDYLRILRFFRFHAWYGDADAGIDPDGLAACADNVEGIAKLSKERIGQEVLKLLNAPNPAPAVASFASTGGLAQALPGADHGALAVLVHIEESALLEPDCMRRLAVLGGQDVAEALRLSKDQARYLSQVKQGLSAGEAGYRFGVRVAVDMLAVVAASLGQELEPKQAEVARFGSEQTFPLKAADLQPEYTGRALGDALKAAEVRWIASDFTLTKEALLG